MAYVNDAGESVSKTFSNVLGREESTTEAKSTYLVPEILRYNDDDGTANNNLTLKILNFGAGGYDYTLEDETLAATTRTGQDEIVLIEPTATTSRDVYAGEFLVSVPRFWLGVTGRAGSYSSWFAGRALPKGICSDGLSNDENDLELSASASSGESVDLTAALWEVAPRGEI